MKKIEVPYPLSVIFLFLVMFAVFFIIALLMSMSESMPESGTVLKAVGGSIFSLFVLLSVLYVIVRREVKREQK